MPALADVLALDPGAAATALPAAGAAAQPYQWNDPTLAAKMGAIASEPAVGQTGGAPQVEPAAGTLPGPGPDTQSGMVANVGAGSSEAVAGLLGMPVDLTTAALNLGGRALGLPPIQNPVGGSSWFKRAFGLIGANPDMVRAADEEEAVARAASRGATSVALPGGVARRFAAAALPGMEVAPAVRTLAAGGGAGGLTVGVAGGVTGQLASEAVPDRFKPLADMLGNLAGGGIVAAGEAGLAGLGRMIGGVAGRMTAPLSVGAQETAINPETGQPFTSTTTGQPIAATPPQMRLAGQRVAAAAGAPPAEAAAALPTQAAELPGQLTAGQVSGNQGLLSLERTLRAQNRAPFIAQEAANNAARAAALAGIAGPPESAAAASDFFLRRLREIEAVPPAEQVGATVANAQAEALPTTTPAQAGGAMREQIAAAQAPAIGQSEAAMQAQQSAAERAVQELGGGPGTRVQEIGGVTQRGLSALDQAKADQVNGLFGQVDPQGTLVADMSPVKARAGAILASVGERPNIKGPDGETATILRLASEHEPAAPFRDLRDLRSRITDEMRVQRQDPAGRQNVAWLTQMLQSVDESMSGAVGRQAANDASSVRNGTLPFEQTVGSRMAAGAPEGAVGAETVPRAGSTVFLPSGREVQVRYGVVDADSLTASHNDDMQPNPAYPAELQPRIRERAASQQQVQRIAGNLQPERLGVASSAMEGAPIIGPDGVVESGNARVLGIRRAYQMGGPQAVGYRDFLARQGFDLSGIDKPVLVRQRLTEMSPAERVRFTQEANAEQGLAMSATERARIDASRLEPDTLNLWKGGEIGSAGNAPFVRAFVRNIAEPGQEGQLVTGGGTLSLEGAQRIRNALLQRAYGDPGLVAALSETGDENIQAFGKALMESAGNMARLQQSIEAGEVAPEAGIGRDLAEAARVISLARRRGVSIRDAVAQQDAFGGNVSEGAVQMLRTAYGPDLTRRISSARFAGILDDYAKFAREQSTQQMLIGEPMTREQMLARAEAENATARQRAAPSGASANVPYREAGAGPGAPGLGLEARGPGYAPAQPGNVGGDQVPAPEQVGRPTPQIIPRRALAPNIDEAAIQRYQQARAAHLERVQTYQEGPVGDVLAPGARKGELAMEASRAAPRLFNPGGTSAEDVQAFVRAAGGRTDAEAEAAFRPLAYDANGQFDQVKLDQLMQARRDAIGAVQRYASYSLRQAAEQDGTLNPSKAAGWVREHAAALDAFPDLRARFEGAAQQRQRLDDLRAERKAIDDQHPLAGVGTNADLAARYWRSGPKGAESVQQFMRDTNGSPEALQTLNDLALSDLRGAAFRNGQWSQAGYEGWMKRHESALGELPDVARRVQTIGDAQRAVADVAARRQDAVQSYQQSAAAHYLTKNGEPIEPQAAIASLVRSKTAQVDARSLVQMAARDPDALQGIRRATVDWLLNRVRSAAEAGTTGEAQLRTAALTKVMQDDKIQRVLGEVLTPEQRGVLRGVAESAALEARSYSATAIRGSPGTAADIHALAHEPHSPSMLTQIAIAELGGQALEHAASATGPWGLALRASSYVGTIAYNAMRAAGLKNVEDLTAQAVLQPELGRYLMQRAVTDPKSPVLPELARRIAVLGAASAPRGFNDRRR